MLSSLKFLLGDVIYGYLIQGLPMNSEYCHWYSFDPKDPNVELVIHPTFNY